VVRATIAHLRGRDIEDFALDRKSAAEREIVVQRVEPTQLQQHSPCSRATCAMQQCNAAWRNIVHYMNATLYNVHIYIPSARCFQLRPAIESNPGRTGREGPESQFYSHSLVLGLGAHVSPRVMRL
jgi:hypothetical protein